jgi:hypothetical protein
MRELRSTLLSVHARLVVQVDTMDRDLVEGIELGQGVHSKVLSLRRSFRCTALHDTSKCRDTPECTCSCEDGHGHRVNVFPKLRKYLVSSGETLEPVEMRRVSVCLGVCERHYFGFTLRRTTHLPQCLGGVEGRGSAVKPVSRNFMVWVATDWCTASAHPGRRACTCLSTVGHFMLGIDYPSCTLAVLSISSFACLFLFSH